MTDLHLSGRHAKHDQIFQLLASLEVVIAEIGVSLLYISASSHEKHVAELESIQSEIQDAITTISSLKEPLVPITNFKQRTTAIETLTDELDKSVEKTSRPGGPRGAAYLHRLRAVTRQAEIQLWIHIRNRNREYQLKDFTQYLNQISNYFLSLAYYVAIAPLPLSQSENFCGDLLIPDISLPLEETSPSKAPDDVFASLQVLTASMT